MAARSPQHLPARSAWGRQKRLSHRRQRDGREVFSPLGPLIQGGGPSTPCFLPCASLSTGLRGPFLLLPTPLWLLPHSPQLRGSPHLEFCPCCQLSWASAVAQAQLALYHYKWFCIYFTFEAAAHWQINETNFQYFWSNQRSLSHSEVILLMPLFQLCRFCSSKITATSPFSFGAYCPTVMTASFSPLA